jgi:prolipoprotein diacylglyceryltransferase
VLGGAIFAQVVEGSKKMVRPFGFYGALIGGIIGVTLSSQVFDSNVAATFAAFAIGATFTQAIGRLRCMVQGCCHGRPVNDTNVFGIRYYNQHSRVCLSGLAGQTIHNTQLYSIVSNLVIASVLLRMVYTGVDASLITGLFFILSGIARFIEEGYRGESQTRKTKGLSLYQYLAILSVAAGIVVTSFPTQNVLRFVPALSWQIAATATVSGFVWAFAMGMDFPKSSARFSRLTG